MKANRSDLLLLITVLLAPLFALAATVVQSVALLADYDAGSGYYGHGTLLFHMTSVLIAAACAFFLILSLIARRKITAVPDTVGLSVLFSGSFLTLSMVATASVLFMELARTEDAQSRFFLLLIALAAISSFIYMALTLCGKQSSRLRMALSVGPIFYALFSAMYLYFIPNVQINAPVKLLNILALLAIALFSLSECRVVIGRAKPALHLFVTSCALVITAAASIPALIYCAARLTTPVIPMSTVGDFTLFAFFLYILARLITLLPAKTAPLLHRMVAVFAKRTEESAEEENEEPTQESMSFDTDTDVQPTDGENAK